MFSQSRIHGSTSPAVEVALAVALYVSALLAPLLLMDARGGRVVAVVAPIVLFASALALVNRGQFFHFEFAPSTAFLLVGATSVSAVFPFGLGFFLGREREISELLFFAVGPLTLLTGWIWSSVQFFRRRSLQLFLEALACELLLVLVLNALSKI